MQLINFVLIIGLIVMFLSGLCMFIGSRKKERKFTKFYLLASIFGSIYTLSVIIFMNLSPRDNGLVPILGLGIFLAPVLTDIFILAYVLHPYKIFQKISIILSTIYFLFISFILIFDTSDFYSGFTLSTDGNSFNIVPGPVYLSFIIFFCLTSLLLILGILLRTKTLKSLSLRHGIILLAIFGAILRFLQIIFGSVVLTNHFGLIWLSPIALMLMAIFDYYAVLRYNVIRISSKSLKILSYVIIIATAGVAYMLIFFTIITFLFKIRGLSTEIYILTFIMVTILLLILPIMSEVLHFIRSLILKDQIYLGYILKKLNKMSGHADADELAEFLALNLHFSYIGILIGKKVHGSKLEDFSDFEIKEINKLAEPERGVWQDIDSGTQIILDNHKIKAVAAMFDAKGNVFGQVLVGTPIGKDGFDKRDLIQLETIVNIISALIDSRAK